MFSSLRGINWIETGMRTKGFGVDWANNTFYHKEYQHTLGEHIAQEGMLKCITVHVWACMLQCSPVGVHVTPFLIYAQAKLGFTQPSPAQWSCTRPFCTIKVPVQQALSELHLTRAGQAENYLRTETLSSSLKKSPFFSQSSLGLFIQTSINSSWTAGHPENSDGPGACCVLQMAASGPILDFKV